MRRTHSDTTIAKARRLVRTTAMTYAEIGAALGGVPGPTVGAWKQRNKWTRPLQAMHRRPIPKTKREMVLRLRQAGVPPGEVATLIGCHLETARRLGRGEGDGAEAAFSGIAPDEIAALQAALARGDIPRADLLRLAELRLALATAEAVAGHGIDAHRNAQAAARTLAVARALLRDGPPAGAPSHDPHAPAPATFEATNALLEELARRFGAGGAGGEGGGAGEPADAGAAAAG